MRAGFAEIDITPPLGTHKIGWLKDIIIDRIVDPIYARVCILESGGERLAFVQLDTLSVRWTTVNRIRARVASEFGFPGGNLMVAAVHNHAGPAVASTGEVQRDDACLATLEGKVVDAFGQALANLHEAQVGLGSGFDFTIGHNRRVLMRDGTVRTHGTFDDPEALCIEGPMDPEVGVLAARDAQGNLLGAIVNYACHPTHHGGDTAISAGYPGALAARMKEHGCPVTLFLNGAAGNIHTADPSKGGADMPMEEAGQRLAEDALAIIGAMDFHPEFRMASARKTIQLPYRTLTSHEIEGTIRGAQRFVDPAIYDRTIPHVVKRIQERQTQPAEIQVHFLGDHAFVSLPGECFVELGLRIKETSHPLRAWIVSHANGMVGYVPTREAFKRGGYETTFAGSSRLAPEAGGMLVACAQELIAKQPAAKGA